MLKVLIACECSQTVCKEFRLIGTEILAWRVLHENLECILRFDDSGKVDLIGIPRK